jgi:hypothetical protein
MIGMMVRVDLIRTPKHGCDIIASHRVLIENRSNHISVPSGM